MASLSLNRNRCLCRQTVMAISVCTTVTPMALNVRVLLTVSGNKKMCPRVFVVIGGLIGSEDRILVPRDETETRRLVPGVASLVAAAAAAIAERARRHSPATFTMSPVVPRAPI